MARKSITRRWLVNGLGVIAVLLLLFEVIFGVAVRNYYYQSVSQILAASAESATLHPRHRGRHRGRHRRRNNNKLPLARSCNVSPVKKNLPTR